MKASKPSEKKPANGRGARQAVSGPMVDKEHEEHERDEYAFEAHEEARRKRLGLEPDESEINRSVIAIRVLLDQPLELEEHERLLIARLLDPALVATIPKMKKKGKGRPVSNATAVKADQIAESYFFFKAMGPGRKHKEDLAPSTAAHFRVSPSYVDRVLQKLDLTRRAELELLAASTAKKVAEWMAIGPSEAARMYRRSAVSVHPAH